MPGLRVLRASGSWTPMAFPVVCVTDPAQTPYAAVRDRSGTRCHRVPELGHHVLRSGDDPAGLEQLLDPPGEPVRRPAQRMVLDESDAGVGPVELDRITLHTEHLAADVA